VRLAALFERRWSATRAGFQWKAALDEVRSGTGRSPGDERERVEAIVWRQRNGARQRVVPIGLGPWRQAAQLHIRWSRAGVWERAFAVLRDAGQPKLGEVFLDGTNVHAHYKAAGAKGGKGASPRPHARVRLGPMRSVMQRLTQATDLLGNQANCRPLSGVLALAAQDYPNRPGTDHGAYRETRFVMTPSFQEWEPPVKRRG
jgi:transposase